MINYHLYRNYWPLLALGRFARAIAQQSRPAAPDPEPRRFEGAAPT